MSEVNADQEWTFVDVEKCTFRVPTDVLLHALTFLDASLVWCTTRHVSKVWMLCSVNDTRIEPWLSHRTLVMEAKRDTTLKEHTVHIARGTAKTTAALAGGAAIVGLTCASCFVAVKLAAAGAVCSEGGTLCLYGLIQAFRGLSACGTYAQEGIASIQAGPLGLRVPTLGDHMRGIDRPLEEREWDVVSQPSGELDDE